MTFKPGQSGNPNGRPLGSRNKLTEDFIAATASIFDEMGYDAYLEWAKGNQDKFYGNVLQLVPKQTNVRQEILKRVTIDMIGLDPPKDITPEPEVIDGPA